MSQATVSTMRKAAILVASLSEQEEQHLIRGLSAEDVATLRQAVADLGPVDPKERQEVLQELRFSTAPASAQHALAPLHEGVELEWSSSANTEYDANDRYGTENNHTLDTYDRRPPGKGRDLPHHADRTVAHHGKPFDFFGNHDTQAIAEILQHEPAQIIAVVLSQLSANRAADLLQEMPLALQTDILERLAQLHPVDQPSLKMLESHLAEWLETHRQQEQRISQGNEKVRQILAQTSNQNRQAILDKLGRRNQQLAHDFQVPVTVEPIPSDECDLDGGPIENLPSPEPEDPIVYQMESLCMLSDSMLLEALRKTDPQITMLALTGAPPHLLDRILGQLPRRQAKQFRRQLHSLQPTSLRDLLAAQQQFAEIAIRVAKSEEQGTRNMDPKKLLASRS